MSECRDDMLLESLACRTRFLNISSVGIYRIVKWHWSLLLLPLYSCEGTLQSLYLKLLHSSTQTSADGLNGQRQVSMTDRQKLSYRKQIARQLRTQYVEGIYRPKYYTVTLKYRLRVTQSHWKRNHWIDHTRLTISWVIWREFYRDLDMWVRGHSSSLKVVPFESLGMVSYSTSIVTMAISLAILETFNVKEWSDLEIWVWGRSRSLKMARFDRPCMTFY